MEPARKKDSFWTEFCEFYALRFMELNPYTGEIWKITILVSTGMPTFALLDDTAGCFNDGPVVSLSSSLSTRRLN